MAKRTERKEINGYTYVVTQMGALRGRKVITKLLQVAGGALGSIMQARGKADRADAFRGAMAGLDDDTMEFFYREFAEDTVVVVPSINDAPDREASLRNKEAFDDIFVNRYADMFQWLVFAFEVNFGTFLVGSGDLMNQLAAKFGIKLKVETPSPSASLTTE